ncbi:MAG: hypoxanthine-guanine phosphoribosyltransferase [Gammaproteobacteria bacterium]|nr:hypoxanthine-guanine phosphoribosyltransferase [Gammaproteobacteria bacterium]
MESADPIMLCVMNGGLMTMSELAKRLNFPLEIDYVHATRYRGEFEGGAIHWLKEPSLKLAGRVVVVVDDILDGGITLAEILAYCKEAGALEVYSAVLVDKQVERSPAAVQQADFTGIYIEDRFVFGFGLDYHNYLRNLPHIYAVSEEHMK